MQKKHKPRTRVRADELRRMKDLLGEGKSVSAINRLTGISRSKIYQIRRELVPRLRILTHSVKLYSDKESVGRYATVEVAATTKVAAEECWAWVEVVAPPGPSLPLHWAGLPNTPEESSAGRITISPVKPARLDVAFVPLRPDCRTITLFPNAAISGQVVMIKDSRDVSHASETTWAGEGCWLAQPAALYNPDPRQEAYLGPAEYTIRVSVGCRGGEGDSKEFVLVSPASWEGLQLRSAQAGGPVSPS